MTTTVTVPTTMSYDGTVHIYTDDSDPATGMDGGGHTKNMIPCVKDIVSVANYVVTQTTSSVASALLSSRWASLLTTTVDGTSYSAKQYALNAAASAATALAQAETLTATSTTGTLIGTGSKTFTTQASKQFQAGQTLKIVSAANSANFMIANVTSYSSTSLVVNVTSIGGSGTFADWNISLSGIKGDTGATGAVSISMLTYANRATLRTTIPTDGSLYSVESLGIFRYYNAVIEPDDDETSFVTVSGTWLVENPHWDLIDANQTIVDFEEDDRIEAVETRTTTLEAYNKLRFLVGTAVSSITSVPATSQQSFTGTVTGAVVGDSVIANPPNELTSQVSLFARVTAPNTVTIYLNNPAYGPATLVAGTFNLTVIKASY